MTAWKYVYSPLDGESAKKHRPRLSFGIETEFALATLPYGSVDPDPEARQVFGILEVTGSPPKPEIPKRGLTREDIIEVGRREFGYAEVTHKHIAETLFRAGFAAEAEVDTEDALLDRPLDRCIVTRDGSINGLLNHMDRYEFRGIELQFPAFLISEGSLKEVQQGHDLLTRTYRTDSEQSCGLHVHVGAGNQGIFSLETLQKLMAIRWTFELQLETLHPKHRQYSGYCKVLRDNSMLSYRMLTEIISLKDSLNIIFDTKSINELVKLLTWGIGHASRLGFNIQNLAEPSIDDIGYINHGKQQNQTIEFRHHEGTTNPVSIYHWIKVCLGIVEFAEDMDAEKLRIWLRWNIDRKVEEFPAIAVLYALKLRKAAEYYEKKLAERCETGFEERA